MDFTSEIPVTKILHFIDRAIGEGRDWPEKRKRGHPGGTPVAAVHRHSLDRLNAIND